MLEYPELADLEHSDALAFRDNIEGVVLQGGEPPELIIMIISYKSTVPVAENQD